MLSIGWLNVKRQQWKQCSSTHKHSDKAIEIERESEKRVRISQRVKHTPHKRCCFNALNIRANSIQMRVHHTYLADEQQWSCFVCTSLTCAYSIVQLRCDFLEIEKTSTSSLPIRRFSSTEYGQFVCVAMTCVTGNLLICHISNKHLKRRQRNGSVFVKHEALNAFIENIEKSFSLKDFDQRFVYELKMKIGGHFHWNWLIVERKNPIFNWDLLLK